MSQTVDPTARYPLIQVEIPANVNFSDHAATFATEMSLIHNVIIRGLNSLYTKAPRVTEVDAIDFAGYALAWTHLLHAHHHGEETILFPFFKTKFDMDHNISQHKEFTEPMKKFEGYMVEVQKKQTTFDGQSAREMIESFGDVLVTHLHEEVSSNVCTFEGMFTPLQIPTISSERLSQFDQAEFNAVIKSLSSYSLRSITTQTFLLAHDDHIKTMPLTEAHVFVLTHHDTKAVPSWVNALSTTKSCSNSDPLYNTAASTSTCILYSPELCILETSPVWLLSPLLHVHSPQRRQLLEILALHTIWSPPDIPSVMDS